MVTVLMWLWWRWLYTFEAFLRDWSASQQGNRKRSPALWPLTGKTV